MYSQSSSTNEKRAAGLMDSHSVDATRLILAVSALLIVDYTSVTHFDADATRVVLVVYIVYSAALYLLAARRIRLQQSVWSYWLDIGWYTVLTALSGGTSSIFFFGFLFAILAVSFERGFRLGMLATIVSATLFILVTLETAREGLELEMHRFLVRLLYLLVLGYLMARWGGLKLKLNRQLRLLQDMTVISPPRLGVSELVRSTTEQLRSFYDADTCLLILGNLDLTEYSLYRLRRGDSATSTVGEPVPAEMLQVLLSVSAEHAVVHTEGPPRWGRPDYTFDVAKRESVTKGGYASSTLATLLDAKSFVTVPLRRQSQTVGRLYLTAQRRRQFNPSDVSFLNQISEHLITVIDSIRLVDRLAADAADEERQRIARDIHDSLLQPYIGLQIGLVGIRRRLAVEDIDSSGGDRRLLELISDASAHTDRLIEMTGDGISELRGYVRGLKEAVESEGSLIPAVQRFASKFTDATNILVQVRADTNIELDDRLAAEIFQMIVEGLSNIRRHTQSVRAFIGLECSNNQLTLRIENDGTRGSVTKPFTPRSIAERAEALGGKARVETFGDAGTSVVVEIPL
jgi:signal transduction histidine kinase